MPKSAALMRSTERSFQANSAVILIIDRAYFSIFMHQAHFIMDFVPCHRLRSGNVRHQLYVGHPKAG